MQCHSSLMSHCNMDVVWCPINHIEEIWMMTKWSKFDWILPSHNSLFEAPFHHEKRNKMKLTLKWTALNELNVLLVYFILTMPIRAKTGSRFRLADIRLTKKSRLLIGKKQNNYLEIQYYQNYDALSRTRQLCGIEWKTNESIRRENRPQNFNSISTISIKLDTSISNLTVLHPLNRWWST